jgi:hypothetical protein
MKVGYGFSMLRYVHDPVTMEFVNIGVALYSREARFLDAICTSHYGRITRMFDRIDGDRFRQLVGYIETSVHKLGERIATSLPFGSPAESIRDVLSQVLPPDDSAIQFSEAGVGLTDDPARTLAELYDRYVDRYTGQSDLPTRNDEEVWRVFKEPIEQRQLLGFLAPKRIVAPDYEYEFRRAWKNEIWHLCEPVSFDMVEAGSMLEKANRWVGRATNLRDSAERFKLHLLVGAPRDERLIPSYIKATNILNKMPVERELVPESKAEEFATEVQRQIGMHSER